MDPEEIYAETARNWAEAAQYHAGEAKRIARHFDPASQTLFACAVNFLVTLLLITLTR